MSSGKTQNRGMLGGIPIPISQPSLLGLEADSASAIELFPAVWGALEALISPDGGSRRAGLAHLAELNAPRFSPLVAYVLASCLNDPDLSLRTEIVKEIAAVFSPDEQGRPAPDSVRISLQVQISKMRTREIYALLEVVTRNSDLEDQAARLLNACPYAGNHLTDILASRKAPLAMRRQAARLIGRVGYLDTIPALERLMVRLESRLNGQQAMSFAPPSGSEELELLPEIRSTLYQLSLP